LQHDQLGRWDGTTLGFVVKNLSDDISIEIANVTTMLVKVHQSIVCSALETFGKMSVDVVAMSPTGFHHHLGPHLEDSSFATLVPSIFAGLVKGVCTGNSWSFFLVGGHVQKARKGRESNKRKENDSCVFCVSKKKKCVLFACFWSAVSVRFCQTGTNGN
jgi:hypothetical protein